MSEAIKADPKVFISYSWTSPDHEAWVVGFAEELSSQGVHVILDKWDLRPGHDANAFMESMVSDATVGKVIIVCDKRYVDKSNSRVGGAGTEAQIITPGLYAKKDQDKFVAVVRERDESGKAYIPVYYGGRIYIDLSNASTYSAEFEKLIRWIYDRPLYMRPEKGVKPGFLSDGSTPSKIASAVAFRRALDSVRNGQANSLASVREYLHVIEAGLEGFRIALTNENRATFDDTMVASVSDFLPYRNEIIELFSTIAQYECSLDMCHVVHRFFEKLIPYMFKPPEVNSWNETDFDNFRFIVHELFLYAIGVFIKFERFDAAAHLIESEYFYDDQSRSGAEMRSYLVFRDHLRTLEYRNQRLSLNRLSVRADMLRDRNKMTGIDFKYIMAADFVLYIRSCRETAWNMWWPETLLFATAYGGGGSFEMFARSRSNRYFERIKSLIGVGDKAELGAMLQKISSEPDRLPRWQFDRINPARLIGFDAIGTVP